MRLYEITGGKTLYGNVGISGAKNAITKQLVASILTDEPCILTNTPNISEIKTVLEMLESVGMSYERTGDGRTLNVQTRQITKPEVKEEFSRYNRIQILLLGPLLHRVGHAKLPIPGGCRIGSRPVDFHIKALRDLGAEIDIEGNSYVASTLNGLKGAIIHLDYPSVGATENIIISAVLAKGTTVINNAAVEPEIIDTILFLQKMGAQIMVDVDRRIVIEGVSSLGSTTHHTIPDRIEAASFAIAAVATNGSITVNNARQEDLITLLNLLRKIGGEFRVNKSHITFFRNGTVVKPVHIKTDVHPGFMTDWQQPLTVLLTQANGTSIIHETVYEKRFDYTGILKQMGADIELLKACLGSKECRFHDRNHYHSCIVRGPAKLQALDFNITDLRAGFAHIIAALVADGTSRISGVEYVERGYANVVEKLKGVGAQIKEVET